MAVLVFKIFDLASPVFSARRIDIEAAPVLRVCTAAALVSRARGGLFVLMCCLLIRVIY